jgi:hypothetical protein
MTNTDLDRYDFYHIYYNRPLTNFLLTLASGIEKLTKRRMNSSLEAHRRGIANHDEHDETDRGWIPPCI